MNIHHPLTSQDSGTDWVLDRPWSGIVVVAGANGIVIRGENGEAIQNLAGLRTPLSRIGRLLPGLLPVMEEAGALINTDGLLIISYDSVETISAMGIDPFDGLVPWAPFAMTIDSVHGLGDKDFRYRYSFLLGRDRIPLERHGWFVRRGDQILRLDTQAFRVAEAMDQWNSCKEDRNDPVLQSLLSFAKVKGLAESVGAGLDNHLRSQNVVIPPKIGVDLVREPGDRISFVPRIDGVPETTFREAFFATNSPEGPFSVTDDVGRHYQIIFDERLGEVARRIWKVRHVGGEEAKGILDQPAAVFDGVLSSIDPDLSHQDLDLSLYSDRVTGSGPIIFETMRRQVGTGVMDGETMPIPLTVKAISGETREIQVSLADLKKLDAELDEAWRSGGQTVSFDGTNILVETELRERIGRMLHPRQERPPKDPPEATSSSLGLLTKQNLDSLDYEVANRSPLVRSAPMNLPRSLVGSLKPHQEVGMTWLFEGLLAGKAGCLLADEMGTGKTVQILAFLSAAIENDEQLEKVGRQGERLVCVGPSSDQPPYNPILIVAPVILLENETWQNDMKKFFGGGGSVFLPYVDLRGDALKKHRRPETGGQETKTGQSHLDLERLRQYRVVLTNYETVVNYQFSFGQIQWSIVITDEAQEYKTPSTRVAHAIKALKATFRVAATGTPVETSLEDIWSIFDFLEPSREMLGTLQEFRRTWAQPVSAELAEGRVADLAPLRKKLGVGETGGRVLRREKADHVPLPPKTEVLLECELSEEQIEHHMVVLERARTGGPENHPLSLINQLLLLTQHPALIPSYNGLEPERLVSSCPKLHRVIEELDKVQAKREKALIFTRSIPMQQILWEVLRWRFGIDAGIINGRSSKNGEPSASRMTRKGTLTRFSNSIGFDVLILSPEVAGLGLTIVEANHVFHYGRWWNPAKELQATDRAYRIGQEKEVFVYYPVASDPGKRFRSIDQSLHALLEKRKELAREFLRPGSEDGQLVDEITRDLLAGAGTPKQPRIIGEVDLGRMDGCAFEALVSALEQKRSRQTILTPSAGDEGIDVISKDARTLWLLQCKHNNSGIPVDTDALDDLRRGIDGYSRRIKNRDTLAIRVALVTSGPVANRLRQEAKRDGIDVWDGDQVRNLLATSKVTAAEWQSAGAARADSMRSVQTGLVALLG